jgi:prephenate dehydrogenase
MINTVRIVGGGLIGTSIGLRLKACGVRVEIQDSNSNAWKLASDLIKSETISNPQVIIVAVPIESVAQTVAQQLNLNPESIVCDLASVKSDLLLEVAKLSANYRNFFSLHPMAGREVSGAENARADLFEGRAWIGISDSIKDSENKVIAQQLVDLCGGTLYWLNSADHDDVVAKISHLPQIFSTLIAGSLNDLAHEKLNLAGQGLRDITRLASADAALWSQILISNGKSIGPIIEEMISQLITLKRNIADSNLKQLTNFISAGNEGKKKIPGKHGAKSRDYSILPIVIDDKPGQLAKIFNECANVAVNVEDLSIEHSPGQETGLITLYLSSSDCDKLAKHLSRSGFRVHPAKNR